MISTGIDYLDKITGGLKLGDNIVWQISDAAPIEKFIKIFFNSPKRFEKTIIYIDFNYSPHTICKRYDEIFEYNDTILLDAFTHGKGNSDPVFLDFYKEKYKYKNLQIICLEKPQDKNYFIDIMNNIQLKNKSGCFYIIDCLTGMNELWKNETNVLDFFIYTCPKLYELNTLAYWIYEKDAHSKSFIAGLTHITQVCFSLSKLNVNLYEMEIMKLEGRPMSCNIGPHTFKIIDNKICFSERKNEDLFNIGEKIKELRKNKNITQAELASYIGMTPGAVSQIENAIISPSLQTLTQIASFYDKSLEYFIDYKGEKKWGYTIYNNQNITEHDKQGFYLTQLVADEILNIEPFYVKIEANKEIKGPIIFHKGLELLIVVTGEMLIVINDKEHILKKEDSILLKTSFINKIVNKGQNVCEFIYILI